ncbi:MAG TPA: DinB family protein [Cyclobacteriaceae bacterium]
MNKDEIQQQLLENYVRFIKQVSALPDAEFLYSNNGKWTAGQQLEHLMKSVRPVTLAFALPSFLMKLIFGKANRPSKTYDALVEKYQSKLATGGKSSAPFIPKAVSVGDKEKLAKQLLALVHSLATRTGKFSEEQLDVLILPHPLLGKLTFREMLFFTIYHVQHHEAQVLKNLKLS